MRLEGGPEIPAALKKGPRKRGGKFATGIHQFPADIHLLGKGRLRLSKPPPVGQPSRSDSILPREP